MSKIENLKQQLDYHDNLYYNKDTPELSDIEYDALKSQYLSLTQQEEYNYVPGEAQFSKYTHTSLIKSLAKVNTQEDLRKELIRLAPGVIEPKLDGLTVVEYPDSNIVTRGDGSIGENISDTAKQIGFPNKPPMPVRMEAFITKKVFKQLNKEREEDGLEPFKNARNAVAGMLRNKDIKKVKGITYYAYNIVGSNQTEQEQLMLLAKWGFKTVDYFYYTKDTINEAIEFINNINRDELDFEIDGMVIKSDIPNALKVFGETEHHPSNMCSYKYPNQGEWTTLKAITRQTGRTGRVTPVGELNPVNILGSTIERATLHNERYIQALGLQINDRVFVVKSNDIIPAIIKCERTENSRPIMMDNKCSSCGTELKLVNDQLFCTSDNCQAKLLYRTTHLVKRDSLNIDGLSEQSILKMIEAGYIQKPWNIFDITETQILSLDGFAKKSAKKIYENIQSARNCTFDRAIYASGIELVGRKVSKDIAKEFGSYGELINSFSDGKFRNRLINIDGVGDNIIDSFVNNLYLLNELTSYLNIKQPEEKKAISNTDNPFVGKKLYCTGTFASYKKDELKAICEGLGAEFTSGYAKSLDYLVVGSIKGSSKTDKALKDGVKVLSEDEFMKMIGR